jgi:VWFA-related protein
VSGRRRKALPALLLAVLARAGSAQTPSRPLEFRSQVAAVYVDAFVTRGGKPLANLHASDFELRDNGVRQQLELLSTASRPLSALMVFDTSSSMAGDRLEALRAAGGAFLDGLRPADEAGLVVFNEDVVRLAEPTPDKALARRALSRLHAEGLTSVFDALYAGILLSAGELRPLVVLFTDGEDNASWLGYADLRLVAERSNALVHVVGWRPPLAPGAPLLPPR